MGRWGKEVIVGKWGKFDKWDRNIRNLKRKEGKVKCSFFF